MDRKALIESLTSDVLTYVMHGSFPEEYVAEQLKFAGLDERFDDFEMLVRLHFILRPAVVDFVEELPANLRRIKTQTRTVSAVSNGTVDGRIDWDGTIRERYSSNPRNRALFVCENRTENYDIDENIVLKRLLSLVHETLDECREYFEYDYDWVTERWRSNADLVETMRNVVERNVHVRRIRSPEEYEPTQRMLQRASKSRQPIYRSAASLLEQYRTTIRGEPSTIKELLERTTITPDDDETLFELYVLFRYISAIEDLSEEEFTLRTIESGSQEVARMSKDGNDIVLYHDSSARGRDLSFISDIFDKEFESLSRTERIHREAQKIANVYFTEDKFSTATRRPDVIVLKIEHEQQTSYLITEVKCSTRPETIRTGIKETLEYLAFLREDGELVNERPHVFGSGWNGLLVVQDMPETATAELSEQRSIRILEASKLDSTLHTVLERVL
jgi:hypothetical protein